MRVERVGTPHAVAEINITPLIDVLLVLLIIFMLVAPVTPRALDAGLPPREGHGDGAPLILSADEQLLLVNTEAVDGLARLEVMVRDILATRPDKTVFVRARGVPYGRVIEVMDAARAAGADRIGVIPYR
jgi:biopolymer transport protein TolR